MKDYLELSRNILKIACCVLEKKNLKGILSFKSPRKKADYQLIDIIDLINLILYSLTEPIEMLRVIKEVQKKHSEIRCDLLADVTEELNKELEKILV